MLFRSNIHAKQNRIKHGSGEKMRKPGSKGAPTAKNFKDAAKTSKSESIEEVKQRLDPKCWKGKHKEGTKIKGGVRVNNCVPNESINYGDMFEAYLNEFAGGMGAGSVAVAPVFGKHKPVKPIRRK